MTNCTRIIYPKVIVTSNLKMGVRAEAQMGVELLTAGLSLRLIAMGIGFA